MIKVKNTDPLVKITSSWKNRLVILPESCHVYFEESLFHGSMSLMIYLVTKHCESFWRGRRVQTWELHRGNAAYVVC